jgi:hypothetical protein
MQVDDLLVVDESPAIKQPTLKPGETEMPPTLPVDRTDDVADNACNGGNGIDICSAT